MFGPGTVVPTVTTGSASAVQETTTSLGGQVDPTRPTEAAP